MKVRKFDFKRDYSDIVSWWKQQEHPVLSENFLSPYGFTEVENDLVQYIRRYEWLFH